MPIVWRSRGFRACVCVRAEKTVIEATTMRKINNNKKKCNVEKIHEEGIRYWQPIANSCADRPSRACVYVGVRVCGSSTKTCPSFRDNVQTPCLVQTREVLLAGADFCSAAAPRCSARVASQAAGLINNEWESPECADIILYSTT